MRDALVLVPLTLVLAVVLTVLLTRLFVLLARAQIAALQDMRLPRSHRRPRFGRAA